MKKLYLAAITGGTMLLTGACADNSHPDLYNGTGRLELAITAAAPESYVPRIPAASEFSVSLSPDLSPQNAYTWKSFDDFQQYSAYQAGNYTVSACYGDPYDEGFDLPAFSAHEHFSITEGATSTINLTATLSNVPVTVRTGSEFVSRFPRGCVTLHSDGGTYIDVSPSESRAAFLREGVISVSIATDGTGGKRFRLAADIPASPGHPLSLSLSAQGSEVTLSNGSEKIAALDLTDDLLAAPSPSVNLAGVSNGNSLTLAERTSPEEPVKFVISSALPLAEAMLTLNSRILEADGAPQQINLLSPDDRAVAYLSKVGITLPSGNLTEFTLNPLLEQLQFLTGVSPQSTFTLELTDIYGCQSTPACVSVNTVPVGIEVLSATPAIIGINTTDVNVATSNPSFINSLRIVTQIGPDTFEDIEILKSEELSDGTYNVTLRIPEGTLPVKLIAIYGTEIKAELTVNRVSPDFTLTADSFASWMRLKISCQAYPELVATIVRELNVSIDGRLATVSERSGENGLINIIGLSPATTYSLTATLQPEIATASRTMKFTTEQAIDLPNGEFEDVKKTISWKDMDEGGLYSQTLAEIFNCRNKRTFDHYTPTGWANTNPKTFYIESKRANTWYMQPSVITVEDVAEGDYAVELISTSFNHNGPEIPPYLQESTPYVRYSRNIPDLPFRAAGKIFLGSYDFNPFSHTAETYREGIPFTSRPESLNGFYTYLPCATNLGEKGLVTVEVIGQVEGKETVIASGRQELAAATGYTAFSINIVYTHFGVKATRIKVMCSSSSFVGDIRYESANVAVHPQPETSDALGARLRLDNLTFAY